MSSQQRSNNLPLVIGDALLNLFYRAALSGRAVARRMVHPIEFGVRALVVRGDEVLIIRHRAGRFPWSLPGGGIKRREPLDAAVMREVLEEAGCPVRVERLHGLFHYFGEGFSSYTAVYLCTPLGEARPPRLDLEVSAAAFVPMRALPPTLERGSRERIAEYLRGAYGLTGAW